MFGSPGLDRGVQPPSGHFTFRSSLPSGKKPSRAGKQDHPAGVQSVAYRRHHHMSPAAGRTAPLLLPRTRLTTRLSEFSDSTRLRIHPNGEAKARAVVRHSSHPSSPFQSTPYRAAMKVCSIRTASDLPTCNLMPAMAAIDGHLVTQAHAPPQPSYWSSATGARPAIGHHAGPVGLKAAIRKGVIGISKRRQFGSRIEDFQDRHQYWSVELASYPSRRYRRKGFWACFGRFFSGI